MRRVHPGPDRTPNLAYIQLQLQEARAAAQTLYELYPHPAQVEPLYQALRHALAEVAREVAKAADHRE
jgi:hypothetical protein